MLRDLVRLSYDSRATIARHLQCLSDIFPSPKSMLISYVVRTAAELISTAALQIGTVDGDLKNGKQIARKMGM